MQLTWRIWGNGELVSFFIHSCRIRGTRCWLDSSIELCYSYSDNSKEEGGSHCRNPVLVWNSVLWDPCLVAHVVLSIPVLSYQITSGFCSLVTGIGSEQKTHVGRMKDGHRIGQSYCFDGGCQKKPCKGLANGQHQQILRFRLQN